MKKLLFVLFLICFFVIIVLGNLFAQVNTQNTGVLYIGASTDTVYVAGSFTNAAGAALTNNAVLNVKGDVTNNQSGMAAGTGTLYLNGGAVQAVTGSQVFNTYHLNTDNPSGITLNNNLSVSGMHTYSNGLITTSATPNYLIYEAGSSYTGDNDSRHVNGWVKKLGTTDFTFPVGNTQYERSIALSSLGTSSEFAVKHNRALTPNYLSLYAGLVIVDTSEYWTINRISGTSAVVTMNWDAAKVPVPSVLITGVKATYYDGTFWHSIGGTATGSTFTTGSVASNATSIFNTNFTIGSITAVLPVQLISFTASTSNTINSINWSVNNEAGIKNYELQRSDDGINFYTISTKAAINSGGNVSYQYNDAVMMVAKTYYRLKYADLFGFTKYSGVVTLSPAQTGVNDFYIVQNPVTDKIDFYASSVYKGKYIYTVSGTSGQTVQCGTVDITASGVFSLPLRTVLTSGIYILHLQSNNRAIQKTILKQ